MEETIYKQLEDAAIRERRSVSNQVIVLIEESLQIRKRNER
ncbi:MAG TPA: hypothetical protein VFG07_08970 [Thermoplasmata archaeon]|nr:hypothetical protein [Thermoplasmata archaeon]